jgi:acyl-CoA thioesterase
LSDLDGATAVRGADGRYSATVDPGWFIWGPNGGYLSCLALRAAAAESRFRRLASYSCVFVGVAEAGEAALRVDALVRGRRAEAFRVDLAQAGRPVLAALLWLVDSGVPGLEHRDVAMGDVPPPEAAPDHETLYGPATTPLFQRIERRPLAPLPPGRRGEPRSRVWMRFRPQPRFDDPLVDSLRPLIVSDTMYWPATVRAHGEDAQPFIAPGLDLQLRFHDFAPAGDWLYCDTRAEIAHAGLLAARAEVWSADGRLLVTSATQALFRPARR